MKVHMKECKKFDTKVLMIGCMKVLMHERLHESSHESLHEKLHESSHDDVSF